ncbi:MAG: cation transporter [Actinomycetota bacterium]
MASRILWASLALAPATILIDLVASPGKTGMFVLAAASLIPLAWLIGESTEHAAEHTGPGIGGYLNASFGNAPELIIALAAVSDGLYGVVLGSLAGSVISNLLLVYGIAQLVAKDGAELDRRSLFPQVGLCGAAIAIALPAMILGWSGHSRHANVAASIPVAIVLLALYLVVAGRNLRRHSAAERTEASENAWPLPVSLAALAIATAFTAVISEVLVHSLEAFAHAIGATDFFIAAIVVAVVGNAAEHGGAVVIARDGNMKLASEIAISSSAQVALLVTPVVMLLSLLFSHHLALTFRWEETVAMGAAVALTALAVTDGRSRRWEGGVLVTVFLAVAVWFWFA